MGAQAVRLSNVDINNALENKDFEVLFQPIFDLGNGGLARMETFVRWRHPSLGVLPPGAFISFFESQGRMSELTRYVLDQAIEHYLAWRGPFAPGFSINLALTDLADDAFAPHLTKILRDHEFPADLVTLECPMPPVDADLDAAAESFERLRKTGARLAIEVRGRANDFLRNLDPFPFDEIKTGGSSILRFARTVRGPGLSAISDLLDLASKANAVITAVGVEDQASLSALRGLGFTAAQGNHLSKVGAIKDFRPGKVNEVRGLLELEPLGSDDLSAMFRTSAPAPKAADSEEAPTSPNTEDGDLVDRLNARVAQEPDPDGAADPAQIEDEGRPDDAPAESKEATDSLEPSSTGAAAEAEANRKQAVRERALKKAKALALAKRAKAREARKAAAIKRAKEKAAQPHDACEDGEAQSVTPEPGASMAPRDLQNRLAEEFEAYAEEEAASSIVEDDIDAELPVSVAAEKTEITALNDVAENNEDFDREDLPQAPASKDMSNAKVADTTLALNTPPPPSSDDAFGALPEQLSLPIGASAARLQKGISVGGGQANIVREALLDSAPASPVDVSAGLMSGLEEFSNSPPETPFDEPANADPIAKSPATLTDADSAITPLAEAFPENDNVSNADVRGTLFKENASPADTLARRKQNFLMRRYRIVPTHFWPKSWKRALHRWRAAKEA